MFEFLKTPAGAYNLTFILAILGWLFSGVGIFAGFHLTKVRAIDSQEKTRVAIEERDKFQSQLEAASKELAQTKEEVRATADQVSYREVTQAQYDAFIAATMNQPKGRIRIMVTTSDAETRQFAETLNTIFHSAGYDVAGVNAYLTGGRLEGISVDAKMSAPEAQFALPFCLAFKEVVGGFDMGENLTMYGTDTVVIHIGGKPRPTK